MSPEDSILKSYHPTLTGHYYGNMEVNTVVVGLFQL